MCQSQHTPELYTLLASLKDRRIGGPLELPVSHHDLDCLRDYVDRPCPHTTQLQLSQRAAPFESLVALCWLSSMSSAFNPDISLRLPHCYRQRRTMGSSSSIAIKPEDPVEGRAKVPRAEPSSWPVLVHTPLLSCFVFLSALFSNLKADPRRKTGEALKVMAADRRGPTPVIAPEPGEPGKPRCFCPHAMPCPALPRILTKKPRFADRRDIPRVTEILLAALLQDPFYIYLWKFREDYPNDHRFYWEHRMYGDLFNPRYVFLVLELDSQRADASSEWVKVKGSPIISFAIWERKGNSEGAAKWEEARKRECGANSSLSDISNVLLGLDFPEPRRDTTPERFSACTASLQQTDEDLSATLSPDRLQMELICTYPCYQRRGAASQLVQWGLERAIKDELKFATATASLCGEGLYKKNGFVYLEGNKRRVVKADEDGETDYALMVWRNPKWENG